MKYTYSELAKHSPNFYTPFPKTTTKSIHKLNNSVLSTGIFNRSFQEIRRKLTLNMWMWDLRSRYLNSCRHFHALAIGNLILFSLNHSAESRNLKHVVVLFTFKSNKPSDLALAGDRIWSFWAFVWLTFELGPHLRI